MISQLGGSSRRRRLGRYTLLFLLPLGVGFLLGLLFMVTAVWPTWFGYVAYKNPLDFTYIVGFLFSMPFIGLFPNAYSRWNGRVENSEQVQTTKVSAPTSALESPVSGQPCTGSSTDLGNGTERAGDKFSRFRRPKLIFPN